MKKHSNEYLNFLQECKSQISNYPLDLEWKKLSDEWMYKAFKKKYMYYTCIRIKQKWSTL